MKNVDHYIAQDIDSLEHSIGWSSLDVVDEHWFWLWMEDDGAHVDLRSAMD